MVITRLYGRIFYNFASCVAGTPGVPAVRATRSAEGLLQLCLAHLRAALDVAALGFGVQLIPGTTARAGMGAQPAPAARRDVLGGCTARGPGLTGPGPLLV